MTPIQSKLRARLGPWLLSAVALTGCAGPSMNFSMDDAKDKFKSRQLANGGKLEQGDEVVNGEGISKPRRKLVQYRYAPTSFENPDFQAFLQRLSSESAYLGDGNGLQSRAPLSEAEKMQVGLERANKRRILVTKEMRKLQGQLNSFGMSAQPAQWFVRSELSFRGASLGMALQRLSQQTHVPIQLSDKARAAKLRVNGQYNGDLLTILRQLTVAHGVEVRVGMQDKSIHVIHPQDATLQTYPVSDYFNPFEHTLADDGSVQAVENYRQLVSTLAVGDVELFNARLAKVKPPAMPGAVTVAYERLNRGASTLNQKLRSFDQETFAIQSGAISNTDLGDREISPAILNKGLLDRHVCPGAEIVTEKLFVYFEAPKEIVSFLDGYFKSTPVTPLQQAVATPPSAQASAPAASSAATSKKIKGTDSVDDRCLDEANKTAFKVIEDPTGVIVTGTVSQIELAVRLANDVDVPTKQVLAEVFLVEVQKNWARAIETKISNSSNSSLTSTGSVSSAAVTSLVDATKVAAMGGIAGAQGRFLANGGDVNAFITLLESNSVGRSISSPTLIAKNGEEASIEKVITLREKVTTNNIINPASGNPVTAPQPQVQKLDVPLKLKIKPTINQHNKHVTMKFEYEETVINADQAVNSTPIEKGTTKNLIATVLETAPGEVVVLAGLFKEANNKNTSSIPGLSGTGAFAPLFGGGDSASTTSTELLVFIKPTVIEPRAVVNKVASTR